MINIQNLHFAYQKKPVFTGLSLQLQPGHIYGLLGKNGTGKSTLLRNIAGLLFPDQGKIEVLGFTPGKRQPAFLQEIFMVPEEFYLPDVPLVHLVRHHAPFYPKFNQAQFDKYIADFDIPAGSTLQNMSYGQKKKVLISFGLASNASMLLMDEPTNGLDIMSKSQFRKVMAGAMDEHKCIVISTHQVKDLENLIDRITIIDEGKILFDQTVDAISRKLSFQISFDSEEVKQALYSESSLRGSAIITANMEREESKLDLELLYKAIVLNGAAVTAVFKD
ncbi:MAG: ABC transporter ATP-binding protein [Chitinophagaceae bacterium]